MKVLGKTTILALLRLTYEQSPIYLSALRIIYYFIDQQSLLFTISSFILFNFNYGFELTLRRNKVLGLCNVQLKCFCRVTLSSPRKPTFLQLRWFWTFATSLSCYWLRLLALLQNTAMIRFSAQLWESALPSNKRPGWMCFCQKGLLLLRYSCNNKCPYSVLVISQIFRITVFSMCVDCMSISCEGLETKQSFSVLHIKVFMPKGHNHPVAPQ